MKMYPKLLSELGADLRSPKMPRALAVGFLLAALIVIHCLALSAIVFSGSLLPYVVPGAGMMLFGAVAFCLLVGSSSSYPGMLASPQEMPATVLGTVGVTIVAGLVDTHGEAAFMTMAALLVLSGVLTGLLFLAIGHFRLSNFFRFIPYPVAGGFFAGTGCVLVLASLSVMTGSAVNWHTLSGLLDTDLVWKWAPGAAYGLLLIIVMNRGGSFVAMMGSVLIVGAFFHLGMAAFDVSLEDAKARGLLLSGISRVDAIWPAFGVSDLMSVDWSIVASHVPDLLPVTLLTLLCALFNAKGLEGATGVEVDLDREYRIAGIAGLCAGAGGSVPGCQSFVLTMTCRRLGADTPWTGIVVAAMLGLSLFYGTGLLELLPMTVIGGVLFFIGGDLLHTWLMRFRSWLHWSDYGIVVLICVVITVFGFIEGVGAGMLATLAVFAFRLSRVDVVSDEFTGRERKSTRIRSVPDRVILLDRSELLRGYRLRGYIFFGSAHRLVDRLKQPMQEAPPPACILLDFSAVSGCDFSAIDHLRQFARSAEAVGTGVTICAASEQVEANLRSHLTAEDGDLFHFEKDLEHALERGENAILARASEEYSQADRFVRGRLLDRVADDLERHLDDQVIFEELLEELEPWLMPRDFAPGERLAERGAIQEGAQFIVSGQAAAYDGEGRRLYQLGPGGVLEPWAAFSTHMAAVTVVAQSPCQTLMLDPVRREMLGNNDSELTLRLFAFLVRSRTPSELRMTTPAC